MLLILARTVNIKTEMTDLASQCLVVELRDAEPQLDDPVTSIKTDVTTDIKEGTSL